MCCACAAILNSPHRLIIAAQAAANRAALLQRVRSDHKILNPETAFTPTIMPRHNRCTLCSDSAPTALIHSPCAMILLRHNNSECLSSRAHLCCRCRFIPDTPLGQPPPHLLHLCSESALGARIRCACASNLPSAYPGPECVVPVQRF